MGANYQGWGGGRGGGGAVSFCLEKNILWEHIAIGRNLLPFRVDALGAN